MLNRHAANPLPKMGMDWGRGWRRQAPGEAARRSRRAIHGGRFNPKGLAALYLALSIEGLFAEVSHGFAHRFPPLTVVTTNVDCAGILDLTTEAGLTAAGTDLKTLGCAWMLDRAEGRMPPTWTLTKRLIAAGAAGLLVPSFATGATEGMRNLVLWRWGGEKQKVVAWDEEGRLGESPSEPHG